eukprot:4140749-Pyramimonas_sp.AAC.1
MEGTPLKSTSPPESFRIILTSPICVQDAPAELAIREPSGLIQLIHAVCSTSIVAPRLHNVPLS